MTPSHKRNARAAGYRTKIAGRWVLPGAASDA